MSSTYFAELKELMAEQGLGKCTLDQVYVFDRLGERNYKKILSIVFEKCTIESELEGMQPRGYAFGMRCKRRSKETFSKLRGKLRALESENKDISMLKIRDIDKEEIITRTLEARSS